MNERDSVRNSSPDALTTADSPVNTANPVPTKRPTWEQAEGNPLPLGVKWIEEEQAFNFAVHSEHAESVTLLLYSPADLVNPLLRLQLDFLHNKSGRVWHCRVPVTKIRCGSLLRILRLGRDAFLNCIASTRRRFSSIRTRSAFSFHPVLIATWPCEKDPMQAAPLWECSLITDRHLTGRDIGPRIMSRMQSSTNFT